MKPSAVVAVEAALLSLLISGCIEIDSSDQRASSDANPVAPTGSDTADPPNDGGNTGDNVDSPGDGDSMPAWRAQISWNQPVTRVDGNCLGDDLEGIRIAYGQTSGQYTTHLDVALSSGLASCIQETYDGNCGVNVLRCTVESGPLGRGNWYFALQARDVEGNTSAYSHEVTLRID